MTKVIVYDFDGVICDSVDVKTKAFVELYSEYGPAIQEQVKQYHLANGGISRFEKFRYFQTVLLGKPVSEHDITTLADRFALLVKEKVISSLYIDGVLDFLAGHAESHRQFVCTGTPEVEIVEIVEKRKLTPFFKALYGSPKSKPEILANIMQETDTKPEELVFFGDAMTDYNAAKVCNVPFIGIRSADTVFPEDTFIIKDFNDPALTKASI